MQYEQEFRKKMDEGDVSGAFEICKLGAEAGDDVLQQQLAFMYEFGMGTAENWAECLKWYLIAAENGNASAQHYLASLYGRGDLVTKDLTKSLHWYTAAAEQGEACAQYILGCDYAIGTYGPKNFHAAAHWFRIAALQNFSKAQADLGKLIARGFLGHNHFEEANFWLAVAFLNGDIGYINATMSLNEATGELDPSTDAEVRAQEFFYSCEKFSATLNSDLSNSSKPKALQFREIECLARNGDVMAQYKIGSLYYTFSTFRNLRKASNWLNKAALQGHVEARNAVKALSTSGLRC
jgi:uncharacterized protein